jgi:repressor LexA
MSRKQLTAKQHSFLQFLAEHVRKQKVWPTYREIVDHFGYRSPNSVTQNLQALAKKGYLTRDQNGYRLIGQRRGLPSSGFPVQGTVEDGTFEISLSINEITLKDLFPELDDTFAVRLENQQAQGVDLGEGGYLLLQDDDIAEGDMAAVLHDGTLAVGRIFRDDGRLRLLHEDGSQTTWNSRKEIEPLGRYVGHINQHGLFRSPTANVLDYAFDEVTVTTT